MRSKMKISRNAPCPCGSGIKYKKCCSVNSNLGHQLYLKGRKAEDFVSALAEKSFLKDWCYRNPMFSDGKELCDLLIVYDDVAIIWQIKDLKLNAEGKYNESEVKKNLRQIYGAKRRLFDLKKNIELKNSRRGKEIFNPEIIKEIYLISALLGEEEDFYSMIEIKKERIIHVFTREFTEIVLNELDTIKDFIAYIREKESLIAANKPITLLGGEKELLAFYLMNERSFEKLKELDYTTLTEGFWMELQKRPDYKAKKEADKISYCWDSIINRAHTCGEKYEKIARELARPTRFERRGLSKAFFDAHMLAHNEQEKNTFRRIVKSENTTYCFLFLDDSEPKCRKESLAIICFIARGIYKDNKKVIGIATEMKIKPLCTYDFCLLEIPVWTKEKQKELERIQKETTIFVDAQQKCVHEEEYPPYKDI